jgi:hypothetical protein
VLLTVGKRLFKNISTTIAVMQIVKSAFGAKEKDPLN